MKLEHSPNDTNADRIKMVERCTILRGLIGSTIHGLNVGGPNEDRDEMGVCVEPIQYLAGLSVFEQHLYRSAAVREGKHDAKSRAGDLDLTIYSLRKYIRLALKGNPTILTLLFVPRANCDEWTPPGKELQALAPDIVSRRAGHAYLGYLTAQKQRFLGQRGGSHGKPRPEYVSAHGYDTKYAMHMLRLGFQGVELLTSGRLTLPMSGDPRNFLLGVRNGEVPIEQVNTLAGNLERDLKDLLTTSPLPEHPNTDKVEAWMLEQYELRILSDIQAGWPDERRANWVRNLKA